MRATALDALQHGFAPFVVREACGDRHPAPHEANLFDLHAKYAEVLGEDEALQALAGPEVTQLGRLLPEPDSFDLHVPVLIVGGGACGLTAALAVADAGADAVVLEGEARCQGSSAMSLGAVCAAGTAAQAAHGIDDDPADIRGGYPCQDRRDGGATAGPYRRSNDPVPRSTGSIGVGVPFELDLEWRPCIRPFAAAHARRSGAVRGGHDGALRFGVRRPQHPPFDQRTRIRAVRRTGTAPLPGRWWSGPMEDGRRIGCDALILATCGFGANHAWVAEHIPAMANARYFGWEANRGAGIAWGEALGGATGDMSAYQGLGLLAEPQGIDVNPKLLLAGGVQVNRARRPIQ